MRHETAGNAKLRTPPIQERIIRLIAAPVVGSSIMMGLHRYREVKSTDFIQTPSAHTLMIESDIELVNSEFIGPIAPTQQETLADISYQLEKAAKEYEVKTKEDPKDQTVKKTIVPVERGQVTAATAGLSEDNVWDVLAHCESTDDWNINTGNGYFGGLQMDMQFWTSYGGPEFAERPDLATKEQQISVAKRARDGGHRGYDPWPTCASNNGLE